MNNTTGAGYTHPIFSTLPDTSELKSWLLDICAMEQLKDYERRNNSIIHAMSEAVGCGYKAGFRIDPNEPAWPIAFIELPTGQVSWHLPQHEPAWDGHTAEEKYARVGEFIRSTW